MHKNSEVTVLTVIWRHEKWMEKCFSLLSCCTADRLLLS